MKLLIALLSLAIAAPAFAHGPTPRKTDESVVVKAAPDAVWAKVSEPCAIAKWHPEIKACEVVDDKTTNLTLQNGGKIQQQIDELDNNLLELLARRMRISNEIGLYKKEHNITILQTGRYNEILEKRGAQGEQCSMDAEFMKTVLVAIHEESIRHQQEIMKQ